MHYSNKSQSECSPEMSGGVVQGSLPASWGGFFSFPKLTRMNLAFNMDLGGPLPATWGGSGGGSLQLLNRHGYTSCVKSRHAGRASRASTLSIKCLFHPFWYNFFHVLLASGMQTCRGRARGLDKFSTATEPVLGFVHVRIQFSQPVKGSLKDSYG